MPSKTEHVGAVTFEDGEATAWVAEHACGEEGLYLQTLNTALFTWEEWCEFVEKVDELFEDEDEDEEPGPTETPVVGSVTWWPDNKE